MLMKSAFSTAVLTAVLFGLALSFSCEDDRDDALESAQVRILNKDTLLFNQVSLGDNFLEFNQVNPGAYSEYQAAAEMPFFSTIEVDAEGQTYTLEAALDGYPATLPLGLYTYGLSVDTEGNLVLDFIID